MKKNVLLILLTVAVSVALYVGYVVFSSGPSSAVATRTAPVDDLPSQADVNRGNSMRIGDEIEIPAGGQIAFRVFDERTGRPTDLFKCETWEPAPGSKDEVYVTKPELMILMPSGMIATVSADNGRLTVDRVDRNRMQPRHGWLEGNSTIRIERDPLRPRDDGAARQFVVRTNRLEFDLELGDMRTPERVELVSDDLELTGAGLHLIWNQAQNRVETLTLARGERLVLCGAGGMFANDATAESSSAGASTDSAATVSASAGALGTKPAQTTNAPAPNTSDVKTAARPPRWRGTTYICRLSGGVQAEQYRGDEPIGGLAALDIELLFDIGSGAGQYLERRATTSGPARRDRGDRLVVVWSGPLSLTPMASPKRLAKPRRHFIASGDEIVLRREQGEIRCGRVEYHDETQRVWLGPTIEGLVHVRQGPRFAAQAESVFIDQQAGRIKLAGAVELGTPRRAGAGGSSIQCRYGAELQLTRAADPSPSAVAAPGDTSPVARTTPPAAHAADDSGGPPAPTLRAVSGGPLADVNAFSRIETAVFVGDVAVRLGEQQLLAQRLDVGFRPEGGADNFDAALETARAGVGVRLIGADERLDCDDLSLLFDLDEDCRVYPTVMEARGRAVISQGRTRVRGDLIAAMLLPPRSGVPSSAGGAGVTDATRSSDRNVPSSERGTGPGLLIRDAQILGRAELIDRDNRLAAYGDQIAAIFSGENELQWVHILGRTGAPAQAYSDPYLVRGDRIDLQRSAQRLVVNGRNRVSFEAQRGFRGQMRGRAAPVVVTSERLLTLDGRENRVRFEGDVVARSEHDGLKADVLTLLLEDRPASNVGSAARPAATSPAAAYRKLAGRLGLLTGALGRAFSQYCATGRAPGALDPAALRATPTRRGFGGALAGAGVGGATGSSASAAPTAGLTRKEPVRMIAERALTVSDTPNPAGGPPLVESSIEAPRFEADLVGRRITTLGETTLLMASRNLSSGDAPADAPRAAQGMPSGLVSRGPSQTAMRCARSMTYVLGPEGPQRRDSVLFEGDVRMVHKAGREMINLESFLPQIATDPALKARLPARTAALSSERLECEFVSDGAAGAATAGLRLAWIQASGKVYLRDKEDPVIREITADRVTFDRDRSLVLVKGGPTADAVVSTENPQTAQTDRHAAQDIVVDLTTNTIRTGAVAGEIRRN